MSLSPKKKNTSSLDQRHFASCTTDSDANAAIALANRLESGLGVLEEHLEVGLVPFTGLGGGLVGIGLSAVRVVTGSTLVAGTVRLTTGLTPNEGIGQLVTGVGSRADTETSTVDVAPVTPLLTEAGNGVTASVHDGVVGEARGLEGGRELGDVGLLVLARVVLGVRRVRELTGLLVPRVPSGNVGGITTKLLGAASGLVDLGELLGTGLEVGVPAEPATVTSVDVHDDVGKTEALQRVGDTILVGGLAVLAGLEVGVGDQVGKRVGLDQKSESRVGVGLDLRDDG